MPEPTKITAEPDFRDKLREAGLLELDALFTRADLHVVKAKLASRQTLRTTLANGTPVFIKRYPALPRGLLFRPMSPARREWLALQRLSELGVPSIRPLALLEAPGRAALITLGLDAPHTMEELATTPLAPTRRHAIARELARITRMMHEGGVNHRDYYLVHIRVDAADRLFITDLNRADIRPAVPRRWIVKDLAALLFSGAELTTRADRARFMRAYTGRPLRESRALLKAIARKAANMARHTRKKVEAGAANYHLPGAADVH